MSDDDIIFICIITLIRNNNVSIIIYKIFATEFFNFMPDLIRNNNISLFIRIFMNVIPNCSIVHLNKKAFY